MINPKENICQERWNNSLFSSGFYLRINFKTVLGYCNHRLSIFSKCKIHAPSQQKSGFCQVFRFIENIQIFIVWGPELVCPWPFCFIYFRVQNVWFLTSFYLDSSDQTTKQYLSPSLSCPQVISGDANLYPVIKQRQKLSLYLFQFTVSKKLKHFNWIWKTQGLWPVLLFPCHKVAEEGNTYITHWR